MGEIVFCLAEGYRKSRVHMSEVCLQLFFHIAGSDFLIGTFGGRGLTKSSIIGTHYTMSANKHAQL